MRAAGSVVWRPVEGAATPAMGEPIDPAAVEVLIVHRPRYGDWSWPKGKLEANEPLPVAAVREVEEESGLPVVLGAPLTTQRYRLGSGHTKEVHYWLGTVAEAGPALRTRRPVSPATEREIDQVRWVAPDEARTLLTRRGDRRLLTELVSRAEAGTLVTATLVLLRHAKAVSRSSWEGAEDERPLSRPGVIQAIDLIDLISSWGVGRILSSPWERCVATVGPTAALAGVEVEGRPELTERAMTERPDPGRAIVEDLLRHGGVPALVCVHRPTLPVLLASVADLCGPQIAARLPQSSPWLRTSEMLVAHVAHPGRAESPSVVGVERHAPAAKIRFAS